MKNKDMDGNYFKYDSFEIDEKEKSKVFHEINSVYHAKYKGKSFGYFRTLDLKNRYCLYYIEIRGFNDYNIVNKYFD